MKKNHTPGKLLVAALVFLGASPIFAADGSWNVNVNGNWSLDTNWNPVAVPGGAGSTVGINNDITGNRTVTIDTTSRTVGTLNIGDSGTTYYQFTLQASGGAGLVFDNGASDAQANSVGLQNTISAPVSLLSGLAVSCSQTNSFIFSGGISAGSAGQKTVRTSGSSVSFNGVISDGSGSVALSLGSSSVTLVGNNTFTGGVTTAAGLGNLNLGATSVLGTGTFTINTNTTSVRAQNSTAVTLANSSYVLNSSFKVSNNSGFNTDINFGTGLVTLGANVSIETTQTTGQTTLLTIGGNIGETGGSRSLGKAGVGTLTLTGSSTYSGGTTIQAGVLNIGNNNALGTGSVTIGAATISSNDGTARVLANGLLFNTTGTTTVGVDATRGRLTFGSLTVSSTGTLLLNSDLSVGAYSGAGNLTKSGNGVLELTGARSATGTLTINQGVLAIAGGGASGTPGAITIANTATLLGSGTVGGAVTVQSGGTLAPGNSPGTLTFANNLTLAAGSTSNFEINGLTSGLYDLAQGDAGVQAVAFGGTLNLTFNANYNGSVTIFDFENYSGAFSAVNVTGLTGGYTASFDNLTGVVTVVPEPSTWLLLTCGLGTALLFRRRTTQ